MNWVFRKLGGAVIAGVGWKLGSDAYEYVKRRIQEQRGLLGKDKQQQQEQDKKDGESGADLPQPIIDEARR